ncbi:hydroxyethylthiazole kinase, partial [Lactobacillus paracasei]|nr:hydroxyethylthiazole kinase [Lacticaseibacillus paracasei]
MTQLLDLSLLNTKQSIQDQTDVLVAYVVEAWTALQTQQPLVQC